MKRFVLKLDSHQLTEYQECQKKFDYSIIQNIEHKEPNLVRIKSKTGELLTFEPNERKIGMAKGTVMHHCMALYYRLRRRNFPAEKAMMLVARRLPKYLSLFNLKQEDKLLMAQKWMQYVSFRSPLEADLKPVGIEVGFSETLYEDKSFLFIYEGKIDLIMMNEEQKLQAIDHKLQSRDYELNPYCNQFIGYAWALIKRFGDLFENKVSVNYFGIQKSKEPKDCMERKPFYYSPDLIEDWRQDTIYWFQRIAQSIIWNKYPRSRSACDNKYGRCDFFGVCRETNKTLQHDKLNREFGQKDKIWQAWE